MVYDDLLVCLSSYPEPTAPGVIVEAAQLAAALGTSACVAASHITIPLKSNPLAEMLSHLSDVAREEEAKSLRHAQSVTRRFHEAASALDLPTTTMILEAGLHCTIDRVVQAARTRSLTVLPLEAFASQTGGLAESLIFGSGRPVVVFAPGARMPSNTHIGRAVIAWDGGRAAARAVAGATPLLRGAEAVTVLSVHEEKASMKRAGSEDLVRHLIACGVQAVRTEVGRTDPDVGQVIADYAVATNADLLIMGAFGRSRAREFILGGATQSLLSQPVLPVFMSH